MRRYTTGTTDQYIYFVAVDSVDFVTRETGLSSFTVYRARNGAAAAAYTTPTIAEVSSANMPGVYSLLLDEDMTITSGNNSEEVVLHITQASMAPVTLVYELYRPTATEGQTLTVASGLGSANVTQWSSSAVATVDTAGYPVVTIKDGTGTGEINTSGGRVWADVVRWDGQPVATPATAGYPAVTIKTGTGTGEVSMTAGVVDTSVVDVAAAGQTDIRAAVGLASANLDTQIATLSTLNAAGVRTAVGLASANLDAQLAQLSSDVGDLQLLTSIYEGTETVQDFFRLARAALLGKATGLGTSTATFRDAGDTKDRITATVDASGNRSVVTLDPT